MAQQPDIRGLACDFAAVEISVDGVPVKGVSSIDYEHGLEPGEVRAAGSPEVLDTTEGQYSASGSMELPYKYGSRLITALGGPGATGHDYMLREFAITVTYRPKGDPSIYRDVLQRVRVKKDSTSGKTGNEPTTSKFDLHVIRLIRGGASA